MSEWRFYVAQFTTGQIYDEIELTDPEMKRHLGLGGFQAKLPLAGHPVKRRREMLASTREMRSSIVAAWKVGDQELCAGEWLIEDRAPNMGQGTWSLSGRETGAYLEHVFVGPWKWGNTTDQLTMAWALIAQGFAGVPGSGLGAVEVNMPLPATSGVIRKDHSLQAQESTTLRAVQALGDLADGFEWTVTPRIEDLGAAGKFVRRDIALHYPQAGRKTDLIFSHGGDTGGGQIRDYEPQYKGANLATTTYALGTGEGLGRKVGTRTDTRLLTDGYPRMERSRSMSTMKDPGALDAFAAAMIAVGSSSEIPPKLTIGLEGSGINLGDFGLGDEASVEVQESTELPDGARFPARILGWTVKPPARGEEPTAVLDITSTLTAPKAL